MRAIIATDFESKLRKLLWITENSTGVSAGIYEKQPNPHATYHIDGTFHCKIRTKGRVLKLMRQRKPPLNSITSREQLLGTAAFYADNTMTRLPLLTLDTRVDTLLVLGRSVFRDIDCASFNISILHRDFESQFIDDAYSSYERDSFLLVAVHLLPLARYPQQAVGVVIYRGKKTS